MSEDSLSAMEVILQRAEMRGADAQVNGEEIIELAPDEDERDFLEKVVRSSRQPMNRRVRAAMELLAYKYPKLGAVATTRLNGKDFASLLERAIRASNREAEVKQIEAKVASDGQGQ
jgi:hypothetical protein